MTFEELYPGKHNFCRVFELPQSYPEGFCFGGGKPVKMLMVDWFNPWPSDLMVQDKSKLPKNWAECCDLLKEFLLDKQYVKYEREYLLVTTFGESMVFSKTQIPTEKWTKNERTTTHQ